ncbi:hypothetical protein MTR67_044963 [Solanum verrucosum]|uniref:Translocon-associated protein subunit alpha n=1 Tax=Solanum verrucosum TaxID=315347 RepID=A0AAF0URF1_SOLVR|nr:hypothetical protein MTR67_044963 [Solanum verrucosum]
MSVFRNTRRFTSYSSVLPSPKNDKTAGFAGLFLSLLAQLYISVTSLLFIFIFDLQCQLGFSLFSSLSFSSLHYFFKTLGLIIEERLQRIFARCQSDPETDVVEGTGEAGDLGIVNDDVQDFGSDSFSPAPGIETVCVFPKNPSKVVAAGEESELLVGLKNDGDSSLNIIAIQASVHLPFDHRYLVQNLSVQAFNNATVPPSAQATFPYIFAVSKFMQPGSFDLVGIIVYEIDQNPFQSTFYNGTIEVTEPGGLLSVESVFLFCLGIALLALLGFWIRGQIQNLSKKTKRAPKAKVEVGTATTDASTDEWLEGTAYSQSLSNKSKKKK